METIPENGNVTVEDVIISTEKFEQGGVQYRRIISVKGCNTEEAVRKIPGYVEGQAVWLTKFGIRDEAKDALQMFQAKNNVPHLVIGEKVREDLFQNAVRHIGISLCRLTTILAKQTEAEKGEKWEGDETVTVKPVSNCS